MSAVYLSYLTGINSVSSRYDLNQNGLDRGEIARASLDLANGGPADQNLSQFLATLVVGGDAGQGVFYDPNGDGRIQNSEFVTLAGLDAAEGGDPNSISAADLRAAFPAESGAGRAIDFNQLQQIANQPPVVDTPDTTTNTDMSNMNNMLKNFFVPMLTMIFTLMSTLRQSQAQA